MTLASARLKASVWFPPLRGIYQKGGTCKGCDSVHIIMSTLLGIVCISWNVY